MSNYDNYPHPGPTSGRRLTRRSHDKMIAGVCGGVADHLGVDATIVRLALVASVLFAGCGVLLYAVAWWLMPQA